MGRHDPASDQDRAVAAHLKAHLGRFFDRAKVFVRELIVAGAMALHGPQPLDADDLAETEREARIQAGFLDRFHGEVEIGTPPEIIVAGASPPEGAMTAARFIARAEMYGNAPWGMQNGDRRKVILSGKAVREARFHLRPDPERHACKGCVAASDRGWTNPGSLSDIGDCECKQACDCYFAFELADGSIFITARGWQNPEKPARSSDVDVEARHVDPASADGAFRDETAVI